LDSHLASADVELHAAMQSSAEITELLNAAVQPVPGVSFTYEGANDPTYPRKLVFSAEPADGVLFHWVWGDGTDKTHTLPTTNKTYSLDGTYTVQLTVTDANGLTGSSMQQVVVAFDLDPVPPDPDPDPGFDVLAELQRVTLDLTMPIQTGKTISVPIGGDFQSALFSARPGDVIELANGGKWSGNFVLPNYGSETTEWVLIRPADMSNVPAQGTRMTAGLAASASLPILESINNQGALTTEVAAHHFRLIGIEVTVPSHITNGGLLRMGSGYETTIAELPHHLVFDRVYVHGTPTGNARRGIVLNCGWAAVVDSALTELHEQGSDSQAICAWNGSGPFHIENNMFEAASENIMFGGGDPAVPGLIATDVTIARNYFTKQMVWQGQGWVVKNLLEMKAVIRCLIEGNVMEYCWQDGQGGSAINLKSVNQEGTCPTCGCEDITFRLNVIHHTGSGFMLMGVDVGAMRIMTRTTIVNNVVFGIDLPPDYQGDGRGFLINNKPADLLIAHNSIFGCTNMAVCFGGPMDEPPTGLRIRDNIMDSGEYGVKGPGMGTKDVLGCFPNYFAGNVIVGPGGAPAVDYPPDNYVATSRTSVGFAPDYSLSSSSPYKGKGTDGMDPGADMVAVRAAIAGVTDLPNVRMPG